MKTLIVVRHAKSSWDVADQADFDRPLTERGKKDARDMAERLKEKDVKVDLIVSSPAKRAKKTARLFADVFKMHKDEIVLIEKLYEAPVAAFYHAVCGLHNKYNTVILVAHNPGITAFANSLTSVRTDDIPTGGLFAVQAQTGAWNGFQESSKDFLFFDYPKNPIA